MTVDVAPWLTESRWPTVPIRYVARLGTGHTPSRQHPEYWENCTVPWVTLADVKQLRDGRTQIISQTEEKISSLGIANSSAVRHPAGTVILSRTASVGFSAILGAGMATSQDFATWTCGNKIDPKFLLHSLRAMAPDLRRVAMGSTHMTVYMPDIASLHVTLPPLDEQRRIADFLDAETTRIDELRELSKRQSKIFVDRFTRMMQAATVGPLEKVESTGVPWMPSMASHWRLGKVAQLFRAGSGTTPAAENSNYFGGGLPWINSGDLNNGVIREASRTITPAAIRAYSALKLHPPGSIVIAMYGQGETKGRVGVLSRPSYVNQACCVLTPTGPVSTRFAYFWFRAHRDGIVSLAFGAGQPNLSQEIIKGIRIPYPDLSEQEKICRALTDSEQSMRSQRDALQRRDVLLAERRQALITAAVTGQFDVTTGRGADLS